MPSLREPVAPQRTSVRCVGAAPNRSAARPCSVNSSSIFCFFHVAEFHCLAFFNAPLDLPYVVPNDRCMVNEDILAGVVAIGKSIFVHHVIPFNGHDHSLVCNFV